MPRNIPAQDPVPESETEAIVLHAGHTLARGAGVDRGRGPVHFHVTVVILTAAPEGDTVVVPLIVSVHAVPLGETRKKMR